MPHNGTSETGAPANDAPKGPFTRGQIVVPITGERQEFKVIGVTDAGRTLLLALYPGHADALGLTAPAADYCLACFRPTCAFKAGDVVLHGAHGRGVVQRQAWSDPPLYLVEFADGSRALRWDTLLSAANPPDTAAQVVRGEEPPPGAKARRLLDLLAKRRRQVAEVEAEVCRLLTKALGGTP